MFTSIYTYNDKTVIDLPIISELIFILFIIFLYQRNITVNRNFSTSD